MNGLRQALRRLPAGDQQDVALDVGDAQAVEGDPLVGLVAGELAERARQRVAAVDLDVAVGADD